MKTKRLIILAIALCVGAVVTAILLEQHRSPVTGHEISSSVIADNASNSAPFITNQTKVATAAKVNGKTNTVSEEGYFKTIIDPQTGQYAVVNLDKQTVISKDKYGNILWTTNLSLTRFALGHSGEIIGGISYHTNELWVGPGKATVIHTNGLWVGLGKAAVMLDIRTGGIIYGVIH
jgi:hypothetical protein